MTINCHTLIHNSDTSTLLSKLQPLGKLVALESGSSNHENGTWSIISAAPVKTVQLDQNDTVTAKEELTTLLKAQHSTSYSKELSRLPFIGGILGAISYDFGSPHLKFKPKGFEQQPTLVAGYYTWAFLINNRTQESYLVFDDNFDHLSIKKLIDIYNASLNNHAFFLDNHKPIKFTNNISKNIYSNCFSKVQSYIQSGDVYQVNLTQSFSAPFSGNPLQHYLKIKNESTSPFLTYMDLTSELAIASASPELFICINDNKVTTKPIKGTLPRSNHTDIDQQNIDSLKNSKKDQAENLMIVDLLRNDLSIDCQHVNVPKLFDIESFELVHHLVSTIEGTLRDSTNQIQAFLNAFPGGSITGAPKRRAMEIIEELETSPRSFYCGSAFLFSINNKHQSNILIRSFVFDKERVTCWAGGGIVSDSTCEAEYQESLDKISRLMEILEN